MKKYIKNLISEDKHHIVLMFSKYRYAKTRLTLEATCLTKSPDAFSHFLHQRKRWGLGAVTNNYYMAFKLSNIPPYERFASVIVLILFMFLPLRFSITALFIYEICTCTLNC